MTSVDKSDDCPTCRGLKWVRFPKNEEQIRRHGPRGETMRAKEATIVELVATKKRGCQICYAVYRAIELLEGIDRSDSPPVAGGRSGGDRQKVRQQSHQGKQGAAEGAPAPVAVVGPTSRVVGQGRRGGGGVVVGANAPVRRRPATLQSRIDRKEVGASQPWVTLVLRKNGQPLEVFTQVKYADRVNEKPLRPLLQFEIFAEPDKPTPWPAFKPGRQINPKWHSKRRQTVVQQWLSNCEASHAVCKASRQSSGPLPPKRLLDLGKNPRNNGIKLVDCSSLVPPEDDGSQPPPKYAAVIVPWSGKDVSAITVRGDNVERFRAGIPWQDLARGVQDSLIIAHDQGLRYAWIDCMCILVDDMADRMWHVDRVDSIFGQSWITLAIASTRRPNEPLISGARNFAPRDVSRTHAIKLSYQGRQHTVFARPSQVLAHLGLVGGTSIHPEETDSPLTSNGVFFGTATSRDLVEKVTEATAVLATRAWTFEQVLMSPRVLYLHRGELAWECAACSACECMWIDSLSAHQLPQRQLRALLQDPVSRTRLGADLSRINEPCPGWDYILEEYPRKDIIVNAWRLWSVAGLARRWSQIADKCYLGGVFAGSLQEFAENLLWTYVPILPPKEAGTKRLDIPPVTYRCHNTNVPSWSWASIAVRNAVHSGPNTVAMDSGRDRNNDLAPITRLGLGASPEATGTCKTKDGDMDYVTCQWRLLPKVHEPDESRFFVDESFKFDEVHWRPTAGSRMDAFSGTAWNLHLEGKVLLVKVARRSVLSNRWWPVIYHFAPANHGDFLPEEDDHDAEGHATTCPGSSSSCYNWSSSSSLRLPHITQLTLRDFPFSVSLWAEAVPLGPTRPSPSTPLGLDLKGKHHTPWPPSRHEQIVLATGMPLVIHRPLPTITATSVPDMKGRPHKSSPFAIIKPDCGSWATAHEIRDDGPDFDYAYLLLIGRTVCRPQGMEPEEKRSLDKGLVLRRVGAPESLPVARGMERVGTFMVDPSLGWFDNAEVQSVRLV